MKRIRVAVAGVGNCASALVQGLGYYSENEDARGLMFPTIGGWRANDIEIVAAFDVDRRKVGLPLSEAIFAPPNCADRFHAPPVHSAAVTVEMGALLDGVAAHMADYPAGEAFRPASVDPVDVARRLEEASVDVFVSYMPVGADRAVEHYAECCLATRVAMVNCSPTFIASSPAWLQRFEHRGVAIIGDDVKSQLGATIVHRVLARLFEDRGIVLSRTYQLNVGGNTDFLNMLARDRLVSKRKSKTQSVQSQLREPLPDDRIHIGPSDYVSWLHDNKLCFLRIEGAGFGGLPIELELRLSVHDSPNSAGVVVDAIRCAALARAVGISGSVDAASSYLMKSPPRQRSDDDARREMQALVSLRPPGARGASRLEIEVIASTDLTVEHLNAWRDLQAARVDLQSPFLTAQFTRIAGACTQDVYAGVLRDTGRIVGFFPFQRVAAASARPVAHGFNDCQAVVCAADAEWSADELLRGCQLERVAFDHLVATQAQFARFHSTVGFSPQIDLRRGVAAWKRQLRADGRRHLARLESKRRRLEREHGPVTLRPQVRDHALLRQLLAMKGAQWARSGVADKFTVPWVDRFMHALLDWEDADGAGLLTVLELHGRPIAMHFGPRSRTVWSYWTTVYDAEFRKYSPGLVMLLMMAEVAPTLGIEYVDLGMEDFDYKRRLMTAMLPMAAGEVTLRGPNDPDRAT
jgi:myo-inositol-1-phosphate synthase